MKQFTFLKGFLSLFLIIVFSATKMSAQTATISPTNSSILAGGSQNFTVVTTGFGSDNNNRTFVYTITGPGATVPASPANFSCTSGCNSEAHSIQFPTAGTYTVAVTVTQTQGGTAVASTSTTINVLAIPASPNLWATSSDGTQISSYTVTNGVYVSGPTNLFAPTFPGATNTYTRTAALGRNASPSPALGHFYWLGTSSGGNNNNGLVEVWGATSTGATPAKIGSFDFNGGSSTNLGFVRLGMAANGVGWILAGDGTTIYLAKFTSNGVNPAAITIEDASVTLMGGSAATFTNGDLCISGAGNIYALANNGSGLTQIFIGGPNGASTTLTKKWDLVDPANAAFTGSVNGVAFDLLGSLYISTSDGLYFIDQFTVNGPATTVQCALVDAQTGLQDLASNVFPTQSTLPVKLLSFSGSIRNDISNLTWETENEQNFALYEIERSNGSGFVSIGNKASSNNTARVTYQYTDNLSAVNGNVFYYRLKMVDINGKFEYSNQILVRKSNKKTILTVNPNPVDKSVATIRFTVAANTVVNFKVVDMSGKVVLQQQNQVFEGTNSVSLNNIERLQPGVYLLKMNIGKMTETTNFSVIR